MVEISSGLTCGRGGGYDAGMKPILVLMAPGFEEIELTAPVDILRRLEIPVVTAGVKGRSVEGAHGMVMQAEMLMVDVNAGEYSGIILPGGPASWLLRDTPGVLALVRAMSAEGKLVAAICAAPIALEAAGVLAGRRVTCYPGVEGDLKSAAEVVAEPAVTDGQLVTGRGPGAALEFGFALGTALGKGEQVAALRTAMCV
jgi:4-methyl-5(b-hydroxyethyl)-thiazole monophosphate biosynthesis